ncbi:MAG: sulfate transporter family protein [Pseudomonadota bacterium]
MFSAARAAFNDIWSSPFRSVFWKALGFTVLLLIVVWIAIQGTLGAFLVLPFPWLETIVAFLAGFGSIVLLALLIAPITAFVAGLFLDEIAGVVEDTHYTMDPAGKSLSVMEGLGQTLRFTAVVVLVNIGVLFLILLPGVNAIAFFLANGYLLGREYFELAARRHMGRQATQELRTSKGGQVFLGGLIIAGFLAVPLLNLLTPLFATAFMVHVFKGIRSGEI